MWQNNAQVDRLRLRSLGRNVSDLAHLVRDTKRDKRRNWRKQSTTDSDTYNSQTTLELPADSTVWKLVVKSWFKLGEHPDATYQRKCRTTWTRGDFSVAHAQIPIIFGYLKIFLHSCPDCVSLISSACLLVNRIMQELLDFVGTDVDQGADVPFSTFR